MSGPNPFCDKPECQPPHRGGIVPVGHYEDDENFTYVPHKFDETNHPSHDERGRLREAREFVEHHHPDYIREHGTTLYHGTTYERAKAITQNGFSLADEVNGRSSGHGVYLTKSIREAREYGDHVVHCKVNTDYLHPNVFQDEDLHHVPTELLHHVLRTKGYTGHIDPDDKAHVVSDPRHVVPFAVQAPNNSPAMQHQAGIFAQPSVGRPAEREDAPNEDGHHVYYRGITLGGKGSENVNWDDDDSILDHLQARNNRYVSKDMRAHPLQALYGQCWTTGHKLAHGFATNTFENMGRRQVAMDRSQPIHSAVLECHTTKQHDEDPTLRGYNEQERKVTREGVQKLYLHLHRLDPEHRRGAPPEQTHVRTIEVPPHRYMPTTEEQLTYHKSAAKWRKEYVAKGDQYSATHQEALDHHLSEIKRLKALQKQGSAEGHTGWLPWLDDGVEAYLQGRRA